MSDTAARAVLRRAAGLIRKRGLHQGWGPTTQQGLSTQLAILQASRELGDRTSIPVRLLADHLGLRFVEDLLHWNNAPSRTAGEVIAALEAAAGGGDG